MSSNPVRKRRRRSESNESSTSRQNRGCLRKAAVVGASLLTLVLLILWFSRHALANALIDDALLALQGKADRAGIKLVELETGPVSIPSPLEARLPSLRTEFDLGVENKNQLRSSFRADAVKARVAGLFPPRARLVLERFEITFHPEDLPDEFPFDSFRKGYFRSGPLPATDPKAAIEIMLKGLKTLFLENAVEADFEFSGVVSLDLGDAGIMDARLFSEPVGGDLRRLKFDKGDVRKIAGKTGVEVSGEEIELISAYPLRVPVMMLIANDAKRAGASELAAQPGFPDDALRHLTWSYELTKMFGPEFAKEVTDAHETLPNNTEEERAMDYHNNAVARELVAEGVPKERLREIALRDPRVIRHAHEVKDMDELRR